MKELVPPLQRQVNHSKAVFATVVAGSSPLFPKAACCYPWHKDVVWRAHQDFGKRAGTERGKLCRCSQRHWVPPTREVTLLKPQESAREVAF